LRGLIFVLLSSNKKRGLILLFLEKEKPVTDLERILLLFVSASSFNFLVLLFF